MKNKKGEIATLLTLGLVVVGTLITLGTSLFVSNNKTNLASNSRATCISKYQPCTTVKSTYAIGGYWSSSGKFYKSADCSSEVVEGVGTYCKAQNPVAAGIAAGAENGVCRSAAPKCDGTLTCTGGVCVKPAAGPAAGAENGACRSATPKCDGTLTCTGGICVKPAASPAAGTQGGACRSAAPKCDGALVCNTSSICAASTSQGQTANQITTSTVTGEGQSCCFQKKGKVYVYASYQSMVNNQMLDDDGKPDCGRLTNSVVSSYTADNPPGAFVCAGGTANMTSITSYNQTNTTNVSGTTGETNGDLVVPEGCNGTNCQAFFPDGINFLATVLISTNKTGPATYYKSGNCADGSKANPNTLGELRSYCSTASAAEASVTCAPNLSCKDNYGGNGNKYSYSIDAAGTTTYYKGNSCYGTPKATGEPDVKAYCTLDPDAEKNATCNKNVLCSSIGSTNKQAKISSKTFNATTVYYDSPDSCDSQSMSKDDAVAACNSKPQDIPIGIENPIGDTITKDGATYYYCFAKTDNSVFENDPVPLINKCKDFYGDDYEIGRKWDNYYCCKKQ